MIDGADASSMNIMLRRAVREASLLLLVAALLGFGYTALTEKGIFADAAPSSPSQTAPPRIHLNQAQMMFNSGEAIFIDARHAFDYRFGHIKGAINIPLAEYDGMKEVINAIPKEKEIVVYCDGAECNSSIQFAVKLSREGFNNVKIFFGGWEEWEGANLPTEKTLE